MPVKLLEQEKEVSKVTAVYTMLITAARSKNKLRPMIGLSLLMLVIIWLSVPLTGDSKSSLNYGNLRQYLDSKLATRSHDLVTYVYYETDDAKRNLEFFLAHGLHDAADFIFIMNGKHSVEFPARQNIKVIGRENTCYDLGSHGEILMKDDNKLIKAYNRFILMNSSVRGPFLPYWTESPCWSNKFFAKLNAETKMVGITANCRPVNDYHPHVQSMVLALDRTGLNTILKDLTCENDLVAAITHGETQLTQTIRDAGYQADALMSMSTKLGTVRNETFWERCESGDPNGPQGYDEMDYHPYDVMFVKSKRLTDPPDPLNEVSKAANATLEKLSSWMDTGNFSSYNYC